ncbi:hypothetical protein [Mesorhizobium sp.]|uniref:hypothetical protein n=1 Tax=Mesorhizobium sp. TaxID=1871066 RepID=UPI0025D22CFC|nr:hypothetical protein [Mesorhizobium sp.]
MAGFHAVNEFRQRPWPIGGQAEHSAEFHSSTPVSPPTAAALSGVRPPKSTQRFCDNDMHKSKGLNASHEATRSRTPAPFPMMAISFAAPTSTLRSVQFDDGAAISVERQRTGNRPFAFEQFPAGRNACYRNRPVLDWIGKTIPGQEVRRHSLRRSSSISKHRPATPRLLVHDTEPAPAKSESIFGKDHARNQSATVSFARPNERSALSS